jgi:hypothetical protein
MLFSDLKAEFAIKDLGDLHYFLSIEVKKVDDGLLLTQGKYASDVLCRAGMASCKLAPTPLSTTDKLSTYGGGPLDPEACTKYCRTAEVLQYLSHTRPDLTFAINKICQYLHSPTSVHWTAVKRILCYIQGTINTGLLICKLDSRLLSALSDTDWVGCSDDQKSNGGFVVLFGSNLIAWSAKKQPTVSHSSTEAEYKSMVNATSELMWVQVLHREHLMSSRRSHMV